MTPKESRTGLRVLALNCSLKAGKRRSSTDRLLHELLEAMGKYDVISDVIRVADYDVKPGVSSDEGNGDDWPAIRKQIIEADILVIGTPIWMGQPSSVSKRVIERLDAFFDETDEHDRMPSFGKVAGVVVVGNEDGAHHVSAELFQALNDVGFTLPPNAVTYWVGEAMGDKNYIDLDRTPRNVNKATTMLAANLVHLATLLKGANYPGKT
jgi:multimeric flavodoxin WrbA